VDAIVRPQLTITQSLPRQLAIGSVVCLQQEKF